MSDPQDSTASLHTRTAPNTCTVIHDRGSEEMHLNRENVEKLLAGDSFFWLDIDQPDADDYEILRDVFKFHPLAVEDSEKFGQRAKIDDYDDFVFLVVYGAVPDDDRLVEVHCFYSEKFLVTVHRDEAPAFTEVRAALREAPEGDRRPRPAALPDHRRARRQLLPDPRRLRRPDRRARGPDLPATPATQQLQEIFRMKRLLVGMRKAITPQRDMFASLMGGVAELPGMTDEDERYFRDIYDHLIRISDLIDTYRDLLTSSMDVYLSTVSNRLNAVMKQLTIMATIFLPLTLHHRLLRPELRLDGRPHRGAPPSSSRSASGSRSRPSSRSSRSSRSAAGSSSDELGGGFERLPGRFVRYAS